MNDENGRTAEGQADERLRRLMRDNGPAGRPSEEFRRRLAMMIDHNFHHHRRRSRILVVAAVAVAAVMVVELRDLGSNSFDLRGTGRTTGEGTEIFTAPFDGTRYGAAEGVGADDGKEILEAYREELAAGRPADRVDGWTLHGRTCIFAHYEGGGLDALEESSDAFTEDWIDLVRSGLAETLRRRVEAGEVPAAHARLFAGDDGWLYFLSGYDLEVPDGGTVTYWQGVPAARR